MIGFAVGFIAGAFSLICLALCQAQKVKESTETVYFVATTEIEGIKLYLNRNGVWGEFSIKHTLLHKTVKEVNLSAGIGIEKIGVSTRFIQEYN